MLTRDYTTPSTIRLERKNNYTLTFTKEVGYEIKRNNDLATVQSQRDLIALSVEMRGWLVDEGVRKILFTGRGVSFAPAATPPDRIPSHP